MNRSKENKLALCVFVNIIKLQQNKFKIIHKNFSKIILTIRFLGKATGHNDHYMINMGNQRPKTGGN